MTTTSNTPAVFGKIVKITTVFNSVGFETKVIGKDVLYSDVSYEKFNDLLWKARRKNKGIHAVSKNEFYWYNYSNQTCIFKFVKNK